MSKTSNGRYGADMSVDLATRIRRLRLSTGKNQTEFGELFGVSQGTVSRWEKGSTPDAPHLAMMAEMAGVDVRTFLGVNHVGSAIVRAGQRFMVKGVVAAGVWRDAFELPEEEWTPYSGGDHVTVDPARRFGLRVEGDSMNMIYPHGTILDCVHFLEMDTPQSGQRVIVMRYRVDGSIEATVKEYYVDGEGVEWLLPRSTNPTFQAPISVAEPGPDVERVEITAVVVGSYRPE